MDRLISERAVIESIEFFQINPQHFSFVNLIDDIKEIPSAEPKTGKWIEERTYIECPNCHDIWHYEENQTERFKFCPTCGERMREVGE